ncbi:MAG: dihydrofolate reductase [Flavisolibacter sp.]
MNDEINKDTSDLSLPIRGIGSPTTGVLSFIVAADENNLIGKDNQLPWHLPSDMKYFKNQTWGMTVIMGRKSLESLGEPLKGRKNIVVTRNTDWRPVGAQVAHSIGEAIELAKGTGVNEIYILGGAQIFKEALPLVDRIYLTRIHHRFEGDAFFPELPASEWKMVKNHNCMADEKNKYPHSFQVWERI